MTSAATLTCITLALSLCGSIAAVTDGAQTTSPATALEIPVQVRGPLDANLPCFAEVTEVTCCADGRGRVGVMWLRTIAADRLSWDEKARLWRVENCETTLPAQGDPPLRELGVKSYPTDSSVFGRGQYAGMCVLNADGVLSSAFSPFLAPEMITNHVCDGSLAFAQDRWQEGVALTPEKGGCGLALLSFGEKGWTEPSVFAPGADSSYPLQIFGTGVRLDIFWLSLSSRGVPLFADRQDFQIKQVAWPTKQPVSATMLYELRARKGENEHGFRVIRVDHNRFDLLFQLAVHGEDTRTRIMHVPDLTGGHAGAPCEIGWCYASCELKVLRTEKSGITALWLDEVPPKGEGCRWGPVRLVEAHQEEHRWSQPRVLCEADGWSVPGLAVARTEQGGREAILAVWCGKSNRLAYVVAYPDGDWSRPMQTELGVGNENWLVDIGGKFMLISSLRGNLYWAVLSLREGSSQSQ